MERILRQQTRLRTFFNVFGDSFLWAVTISAAVSTAVILATTMIN